MEMVTNMFSKMNTNDLKSLKKHLEKDNDALKSYKMPWSMIMMWIRRYTERIRMVSTGTPGQIIFIHWNRSRFRCQQYDVIHDEYKCVLPHAKEHKSVREAV